MTTNYCPQHHCPLIPVDGRDGPAVCLVEQARALVGQPIVDLAFGDDVTVLIFPDYRTLPLPGWNGNLRALGDAESAVALLEVLDGTYLTGLRWSQQTQQLAIYIGDDPQVETGQWFFSLILARE